LCSGRPVPMAMAALRWSTRDGKRRYGFGSPSWSYWRRCLAPAAIQGDDPAATSRGGGASRDGGTQGGGGQGSRGSRARARGSASFYRGRGAAWPCCARHAKAEAWRRRPGLPCLVVRRMMTGVARLSVTARGGSRSGCIGPEVSLGCGAKDDLQRR
jgi:hypothetical protein